VTTPSRTPQPELCVVVPFYNEARGMRATLDALARQSDDDFALVLVDNGSTDDSARIAAAFAQQHHHRAIDLIAEPEKGTGSASDTGFRHAIARGARWIARTDADCIPARDWVRNIRRALATDGLEFVAGRIRPREDDIPLSRIDRCVLPLMIFVVERYGRIHHRGKQFKYPFLLAAGNNLAITADLYVRSGGFPRTAIEREHEDLALSETVRTLTIKAAVRSDVIVYNSVRRVKAYGYLNTLRWYRNHGYRARVVDVR